jgi:hypothetical protein
MSIVERGTIIDGHGANARAPKVPSVSGRFYGQRNNYGGVAATLALAANTLYGVPFVPPADMAVDRVAANITSAASAGKLIRIGLYDADPVSGAPRNLLAASGALAADATGLITATIDQKLRSDKLYWLACVSDGTPTLTSTTGARSALGVTDASDAGGGASVTRTFTYAALPATWGTIGAYVGPSPYLVLRAV